MSLTLHQTKEVCRTYIDVALRMKRGREEGFESLVIQNTLNATYPILRTGTIPELESAIAELRGVVKLYTPRKELANA